ncbi:YcaO-like family protein [Desulfonatronovibrio magnus]|uniref:YcaO-like family protein n=1 Tax=Desulfonatronovibrio magnus TaxID=698827 RepID=UPI0005EB84BC|nr:YcaO-like family protein [Desulfonatronovibrio magnus]
MISIGKSLKNYTQDADKSVSPQHTVDTATKAFSRHGGSILSELRRIDTGRLEIPVYLSISGVKARETMPTRKQMGKGSTPVQAKASALMELAERFSYFSFVQNQANFHSMPWNQAQKTFNDSLIPLDEIIKSTGDDISTELASKVLSLVQWQFTPATLIHKEQEVQIPFNWFKKLNEFNGCSAGNTHEESILQGACELVERHCCAVIDSSQKITPTIDQDTVNDPVLSDLINRFRDKKIKLILKDFTLDMPVPTVAALAYDPATFPGLSEIVFTAGTATSPEKAAIRALTEVAQLAGDFESAGNYEASGLSKFSSLDQIAWIQEGPLKSISSLPNIANQDMGQELKDLCQALETLGFNLYSLSTHNDKLNIPAHYNFIPGFKFRERTINAGIGLITGRILAEETEPATAIYGLEQLSELLPGTFYQPFFQGLLNIRLGDHEQAVSKFTEALPLQPDNESIALCAFYAAYALTLRQKWTDAFPYLNQAIACDSLVKEYFNLRGVAFYKQQRYENAINDFLKAIELDSGSAMDLANLGLCYLETGKKQAARETLSKALELDPDLKFARKKLDEMTL